VIRLQKVLADRGVASRRHAEELIAAGRVRVDGAVVRVLGTKVAPDARIDVDGTTTHAAAARYIALHKPAGIVSTARDERGRRTVLDLVTAHERLYPVGRLDSESEGLVLLTNDGAWADRVLHPRYGHEREYEVTVSGELAPSAIAQLKGGIRLEEGRARADRVDVLTRSRTTSRLRMVLRTGWKRQIRRMCAAVGLRVERLVRVRIGTLRLGRLRSGESRDLTRAEIADLARPVERERSEATPAPRAVVRRTAPPRAPRPGAAPPTRTMPTRMATRTAPNRRRDGFGAAPRAVATRGRIGARRGARPR